MTDTTQIDLARLGDALHRAARRDLRSRRRSPLRLALAVAAVCALGAGTALATGVFSEHRVEQGMPAGSVMFGGTEPRCSAPTDGVTYHCTLTSLPTEEVLDDYLDTKELVTIDGRIAGGCIGQDRAGRTWDCYLGEEAVKHEILARELLGEPSFGPGRG